MSPWLVVALLGAAGALDWTAGIHSLLSRPLTIGALAGLALGDPVTGVSVGIGLQLVWLVLVPGGNERIPDSPAATVAAAAVTVEAGGETTVLGLAVLYGVAIGAAGGWLIQLRRRLNGRLHRRAREAASRGGAAGVVKAHRTAVLLGLLQGALFAAAAYGLGRELVPGAANGLPEAWLPGVARWPELLPAAGAAAALHRLTDRRTAALAVAGCMVGVFLW
jgi:PTS system mannose-specific IIC component